MREFMDILKEDTSILDGDLISRVVDSLIAERFTSDEVVLVQNALERAAELEQGLQRIAEVSGGRAASGFNEAGRLSHINQIARGLIR